MMTSIVQFELENIKYDFLVFRFGIEKHENLFSFFYSDLKNMNVGIEKHEIPDSFIFKYV